MSSIHIINARTEHIPVISQLEREAASVYPPGLQTTYLKHKMLSHSDLLEGIVNDSLFIALTNNGRVQGFILIRHVTGLVLLSKVDVRPQLMRRGIGTQLINTAIEKLPSWGHTSLWLTTFSNLPWTVPFYEKIGFRIVPEELHPEVIRKILAEEKINGLENRVAMKFSMLHRNKAEPGPTP